MEYFLALGYPGSDVDAIERMVIGYDSLVYPTSDAAELQTVAHLRYAAVTENFEVRVLLDNNILTRVVAIARGEEPGTSSDGPNRHSSIAALMSFFQLADIAIEPGVALFEKAYGAPHEQTAEHFKLFQVADEVNTGHWIDLAVGRTSRLQGLTSATERAVSRGSIEPSQFAHKVQPFLSAYLSILKLIEMQRLYGNGVNVIADFMYWMKDESVFDGLTLLLAMYHFSSTTEGARIKKSGSDNYRKVLRGARNAAWDNAYVRQWTKVSSESEGKFLWLFCTNDYKLREVARSWVNDDDHALENVASLTFGPKGGVEFLTSYNEIWSEIRSGKLNRIQKKQAYWESLEEQVSAAEKKLQQLF